MGKIGNCAAGWGIRSYWSGVEIFAFQASIAVYKSGDFGAFGKRDVFSMHHWNNHACRGTGPFGFASGSQNGLLIVREADAPDKDAELAAAAESLFGLRFIDDAGGIRSFGDDEEPIHNNIF